MFEVREHNAELILDVSDGRYADALYAFVHALLKTIDVSYLSREQVHSTFMDDFRALFYDRVDTTRMAFEWYYLVRDPQGKFKVDCRINGMPQPLCVYALSNNDTLRDATIALHQFKEWNLSFHSMGIFEES